MRIASRVVGVVLVLAGLVFLGLSVLVIVMAHPESVLEGSGWDRRLTGGLSFIVVGAGFVLGGWHYLKLDVDQIDDASGPARFALRAVLSSSSTRTKAHRTNRARHFTDPAGRGLFRTRLAGAMGGVASYSRGSAWLLSGAGSQNLGRWIWTGKPFPKECDRL
jgi:hypothetical protein